MVPHHLREESNLPSLNPGSLARVSDGVPAQKPTAIGVNAPDLVFIEPALTTALYTVPKGDRWLHDIKF
jgi:hypothetical protein